MPKKLRLKESELQNAFITAYDRIFSEKLEKDVVMESNRKSGLPIVMYQSIIHLLKADKDDTRTVSDVLREELQTKYGEFTEVEISKFDVSDDLSLDEKSKTKIKQIVKEINISAIKSLSPESAKTKAPPTEITYKQFSDAVKFAADFLKHPKTEENGEKKTTHKIADEICNMDMKVGNSVVTGASLIAEQLRSNSETLEAFSITLKEIAAGVKAEGVTLKNYLDNNVEDSLNAVFDKVNKALEKIATASASGAVTQPIKHSSGNDFSKQFFKAGYR